MKKKCSKIKYALNDGVGKRGATGRALAYPKVQHPVWAEYLAIPHGQKGQNHRNYGAQVMATAAIRNNKTALKGRSMVTGM